MVIKLVQKIKLDGNPCRKSAKILNSLHELNLIDKIDAIISADERNPHNNEGFILASQYQVSSAPFFIVENDEGEPKIYTAYYRFMKDIFNISIPEKEEISEIMAQNPELDYI
ncbi:hypothetical protein [Mastigocoleus testarum]|uniref:Thioredoxin-like fold domain-containing protein n=1 Tax=Mastigocoleus testarum BC008 TaxID=371196 RepID=A0A0V7ZM94_9CYAN|nr:hypothetical protein [Mastigocoleus testarum]KST65359.1 hypothetical protein BC008_21410 [Mastigocoleus testarum BC008]KST70423.1 hypothetical protein BC008_45365 [Mastigocoleus testarum BC008]